ncbi:hypothetical protein O181_004218 [Austropuccinia psidii MF-1]|uniref:Uncharacterized protein n=1 Tax=Austropuccinia psidii MF-1 TaxID=1389203 RepID=A0A9Q3BG58_9BASI|nr:hypothetical protein [Austropuccinia psidii MF-1]
MPVHQENKLWMRRMRTCLPIAVKQIMNQGGKISWHMRMALSQIVSSLTQSMLEQSKIRQQMNQACKGHNLAKGASQKEQKRWLKVELPENVHGMRSAVHSHCLFLLKLGDKDFSSLPPPPSTEEHEIVI